MLPRITSTRSYYVLYKRSISRPLLAATGTAPLALWRNYSLQSHGPSSTYPSRGSSGDRELSPNDLLNKMEPKNEKEVLASIIDGELDYDTDMGAASVNNIEAKLRAEATARAERIANEGIDEFTKRHLD
ncbi:hypothetical protein IWW37_000026 [Coemansia sp. RSA 2050]|nr:hypothetical protein IWW37_000026 [Coemansia sp. RSA 2050]KAJ2737335.1 hypothetical protein IW152_000059 [Coemansia sp. BCRC 34962]